MPKEAKPLPELTEQQKDYIRAHWDMDRRLLVQNVFSNPDLTLRNVEAKAVEQYLIGVGLSGKTDAISLVTDVELTEEHKEYIHSNHADSNPLEMTRALFNDPKLLLTSAYGRAVLAYLKKIAPERYDRNNDPVDDMEYKPPRNLTEMITRVNRLVPNPNDVTQPIYVRAKLNAQQEKNLFMLLSCVNIPRFIHQASQYLKRVDRELFESSFLRQIHDNPDLTAADVDQYIAYCASIVSSAQTDRTIQRLQTQADDEFETNGKVSMTLIEHLKQLGQSLQEEKKRQEALYKILNGARSTRLSELTQASNSMHPLVQAWRRKESRSRLLAAAGKRREALKTEIKRLTTDTESLRAEIWGIDPEEIVK